MHWPSFHSPRHPADDRRSTIDALDDDDCASYKEGQDSKAAENRHKAQRTKLNAVWNMKKQNECDI